MSGEDKPDVAHIKLLEIAKHSQRLKRALKADYQPAEEMAFMLTPLCAEPGVFDKWSQKLSLISDMGVLRLREESPAQAKALGVDEDACPDVDILNDREPWLIPSVHRDFVRECLKQLNLTLNGLDALTRVGGFALNQDEEANADRFELYATDVFISWHGVGTKATLKGAIKSGKSNAGLYLAELFLAKGINVASNILIKTPVPNGYHYCPKLSDLLITVCKSNIEGKESNIIFDEANLFFAKVETVRPRNVDLSKLALCFGKMHASLTFISHYQSLIPTVVAQTAVAEFEKLSKRTMLVDIRQGMVMHSRTITDWPACTLAYDPDQLQWFQMNIDIEGLFSFMSGLSEDEAGNKQWKLVMDYAEKHKDEISDEDVDPKAFAQWLRKKGKSVPEIAAILEKPRRTVQDWVQGIGK